MGLIIGVDFGTTRSGYAFVIAAGNPGARAQGQPDVVFPARYEGQPVPYVKTLTQLLYGANGTLIRWGWPAVRDYQAAVREAHRPREVDVIFGGNAEDSLPRLCGEFKLAIQNHAGANNEAIYVHPASGWRQRTVILVADYLRKLKEMAFDQAQVGPGKLFAERDVLWCLTVPAIWSDADKALMRDAAARAAMIGANEHDRLLLVLEPEAAAADAMWHWNAVGQPMPAGSRFMVVDAGGGTVDITVHQVEVDRRLREVVRGTGAACGSTFIDRQFEALLVELFGEAFMGRFRREDAVAMQELMNNWERSKCDYDGTGSRRYVNLPAAMYIRLRELAPERLRQLASRQQDSNDESIELDATAMNRLFEPVLRQVVDAVRTQFALLRERREKCDHIILVGGFAESKLLQERIRSEFRAATVHVPHNPGRSVVQGAVLFGLDDSTVSARCVRRTYGCTVGELFRDGVDPPSTRTWNADRQQFKCNERFSRFVSIGDVVSRDQPVAKPFRPAQRRQSTIEFDFFSTDKPDAQWVTEPHMVRIGTIQLSIPNPDDNLERSFEASLLFGRSEIVATARDLATGASVQTTIRIDGGTP